MSELNIEQEHKTFEEAYRAKWPTICAVNHRKFELDEDNQYLDYTVQVALEMWLAAKRASMGSTEPVGYGVFWNEAGMQCSALKGSEDEALRFSINLGIAGASIEPVYRGAQPSTDAKDARLHHLYDKQMAQLVKPCMSYNEWLNAIDVCISGDAAKEPTP